MILLVKSLLGLLHSSSQGVGELADFLMGALSNLSGQAADPFRIPPGTATQHGAKP